VTRSGARSRSSARIGSSALIYLDASALVKVILVEAESHALRSWIAERPERLSSAIVAIELRRATRRVASERAGANDLTRETDVVLSGVALIPLDERIAQVAASLDPLLLRTLDAIHLASALSLGGVEALVTYDARLAAAAAGAGLAVASPGA